VSDTRAIAASSSIRPMSGLSGAESSRSLRTLGGAPSHEHPLQAGGRQPLIFDRGLPAKVLRTRAPVAWHNGPRDVAGTAVCEPAGTVERSLSSTETFALKASGSEHANAGRAHDLSARGPRNHARTHQKYFRRTEPDMLPQGAPNHAE